MFTDIFNRFECETDPRATAMVCKKIRGGIIWAISKSSLMLSVTRENKDLEITRRPQNRPITDSNKMPNRSDAAISLIKKQYERHH